LNAFAWEAKAKNDRKRRDEMGRHLTEKSRQKYFARHLLVVTIHVAIAIATHAVLGARRRGRSGGGASI
jgi:hypothetical protein